MIQQENEIKKPYSQSKAVSRLIYIPKSCLSASSSTSPRRFFGDEIIP